MKKKKYLTVWKRSKLQGGKLEWKLMAHWMFYGICTFLGLWMSRTGPKNSPWKPEGLGADD